MDFNQRFMDIRIKMKEKERLLSLSNRVEAQISELETRKSELFEILKKEEKDVKNLEGMSLTRFIHFIKRDSEDVLYKEQQEAIAAKMKYDGVCAELEELKSEIENVGHQLNSLGDLEGQHNILIREKEAYIKSNTFEINRELDGVVEKQADIRKSIKELEEALYAGRELGGALNNVRESLNSAENWGVYDIFGGGLLATMAKHERLDEANTEINRAQSLLKRFHRELQDIGKFLDISIDIGSFLTFADYFFDGFFSDWAVQNRINDAQNRLEDTVYRVNAILSDVQGKINQANREFDNLEKKRMDIIEKA